MAGPPRLLCSRARFGGYRARPGGGRSRRRRTLVVPGDFRPESGLTGCTALLGLPEPPTAVFTADDRTALGTIEALRRRGLRAPEDMGVVGFDDLRKSAGPHRR
ncbi:substrate-binding domain-containing protein [Streptomyces sp. NPDC060000]|uniref:substrate-binding domain-containing protein n=1 Tax=Streptomyces sp. NPDC060000 TaxID=3347031 RepID=UPI00369AB774